MLVGSEWKQFEKKNIIIGEMKLFSKNKINFCYVEKSDKRGRKVILKIKK